MRVKAIHKVFGLLFFLFLFFTALHAKDLPESHDHPALKRYEGSDIIKYDYRQLRRLHHPAGRSHKFAGTREFSFSGGGCDTHYQQGSGWALGTGGHSQL